MQSSRSFSATRLLVLLVPALLAFWLWNTRYQPIREYKVYLTDKRLPASMPWQEVSASWTEAYIKDRFKDYPVRCMPDETGVPDVVRNCHVDVKELNGAPTMVIGFLFTKTELRRVATTVPWWSHDTALRSLVEAYGQPLVVQRAPVAGVRLIGWQLPSGSTLFFNRDREKNPLEPSSAQWLSPTACSPGRCIQ